MFLTGLLRFGRYDEVLAALFSQSPPEYIASARRAAEFGRANAAALAGPWKDVRGLVQIAPGGKAGITWALRYDGEVFRLAGGGPADRFGGLAAPLPR